MPRVILKDSIGEHIEVYTPAEVAEEEIAMKFRKEKKLDINLTGRDFFKVIVDCETTGILDSDRIIQFAAKVYKETPWGVSVKPCRKIVSLAAALAECFTPFPGERGNRLIVCGVRGPWARASVHRSQSVGNQQNYRASAT